MKKTVISVIVPVYKAEKYLYKCVNGLLAQTFTDFEVLLIDDGSPDKSGKICDEYAKKDSRVKVFHKENGGVSSARQCGLDNAQGEYVIHADPDDWVEPTMLEELYNKAKEDDADMVICDYISETRKQSSYIKQEPKQLTADAILRQLLFQQLHGSCWNKLVKLACYNEYNVSFPLNIVCWEDLYVICELLRYNIKVSYLPKAFYHYDNFTNSNSIVRNVSIPILRGNIFFCEHFSCVLDKTYEKELITIKRFVKKLAFLSGLINKDEFESIFKNDTKAFIDYKSPNLSIGLQIKNFAFIIALKGYYKTGKLIHCIPTLPIRMFRTLFYK